jgi:2,4-dienoyl-CoA reductase (NADPH2)
VVLVEMLDRIGSDIGKSTRWAMLQEMERSRIDRRIATKAVEITESGLSVEADGKIEEIKADTIVIAAGSIADNALEGLLEHKGIPYRTVGDAKTVGQAIDAVHQGYLAAMEI